VRLILCVLLLALTGCHSSKERTIEQKLSSIPLEDQEKLEHLFHYMFTGDYFGAVLFGNKPMTFQEFHEDPWKLNSAFSIFPHLYYYLEQGWNTWLKYETLFPSEDYLFAKIPAKTGYEFIILINREAFAKMFEKNQDLFVQALGDKITADAIILEYQKGEKTFSEVLNEDEGLVGLVLGYGREATLLTIRKERASHQLFRKSLHPLTPPATHEKLKSQSRRISLHYREKRLSRLGYKWHQLGSNDGPADPYKKLNQSRESCEFVHPSWQMYLVDILPPNFSCVKKCRETKQLKKEYAQSMRQARKVFAKKSFLSGFLEQYCEG